MTPTRPCSFSLLSALLSTLLLATTACAQESTPPAIGDGNPYSAQSLAQLPGAEWLTNGGHLGNQRYSTLDQINRDNVAQLKGVWRAHLDGSGMGTRNSGEAQPLYDDGVVYVVTGDDGVFALDVASGAQTWKYEAVFPEGMGKSVCCGWTSRGVGMSEDKIFVGQLDAKLVALDKATGAIAWETQAARWEDGYSITSAPLYYEGMVITGFSGAEYGVRGMVKAFDADTGAELWTFYTVPGPGDFGHDTWPQDSDAWKYGGGTVWQTPAVDPELGLLYFSTGNPGPDYNGAVRAGDNLFTASIVALDVSSGEYRWHFQQVHHDIWDYDAPNPVILFDMEHNGVLRQALAQASKTGWVYILDRVTGEPIVGIEERPVPQEPEQLTSATQPYPIGDSFVPQSIDIPYEGTNVVNDGKIFTPFGIDKPVLVQPSPAGSANWPPSAYDPTRNIMYVCAAETAMTLVQNEIEVPEGYLGELYTGGGFGGVSAPQRGIIAALDMATNTLVWQWRWPESCYSGFMATAGDLLFVGRNDGRLTALDIDTGRQLWAFQTGAGMNASVTTFEQDGKQYVAAYSAGNIFAGSHHGDSVWLFALDGTLPETTPGDTVPGLAAGAAATGVEVVFAAGDPDYAAGEALFKQTCMPCHGDDGMGGHNNGMPLNNLTDIRAAISVVTTGRNAMPTFNGALSPEQIRDVSGYIVDRLFED
jgi:alcohol dehydrogenase (cytochrome c)